MPDSGLLSILGVQLLSSGLAFAAGYVLQRVTQRETRHYERETKRLQFLKVFYEVNELSKPAINPEFDVRAEAIVSESRKWLSARPDTASTLAKKLSIILALALVSALLPLFVRAVNVLHLSPDTPPSSDLAFVLRMTMRIMFGVQFVVLVWLVIGALCEKLLSRGISKLGRKRNWNWPFEFRL